jgi:hypothetical protein
MPTFCPSSRPFDVLPLRARLGLAHPTGMNRLHAIKNSARSELAVIPDESCAFLQ